MLIRHDDRRIYADLAGPESGPVVCMTHSLVSDGGMWAEQMAPLLGAGYRVLRLDMRGHGGSEPGTGDYTMDGLADDVVACLDFLGISRVHYIGLSIGGMIGQAFAIKHGHRLVSTMLCATSPQAAPNARDTWQPRMDTVKKANSLAPLGDATMERWFTESWKPANPSRYKQLVSTIVNTTPGGYLGCAAAILGHDFIAGLPTVKTPALVVCGADDAGTPPAGGKRIAELIPGGRYEEIANARHFPNVERADEFNGIMMAWLAKHR